MNAADYCRLNPGLEIQDLFKYLFQSCFGCEHLLRDPGYALDRIMEELPSADDDRLPGIEPLEGDYCRFHLKQLAEGIRPETLCALFRLSAVPEPEGMEKLRQKLAELPDMAQRGILPFTPKDVADAVTAWEKNGFQACHHSPRFRELYRPAYRVIRKEYLPLLPLLARVDTLPRKQASVIAIDGRCASGKTTLAAMLETIFDCNVFHMDDYFLRPEQRTPERLRKPGGNTDHERFLSEVLGPLVRGETVIRRKYDCHTGTLGAPEKIPPKALNFVEGVYCLHPELSGLYDLKIVLDVPRDVQEERIRRRNSPAMAARFFREWIPMEEAYFEACSIYSTADLCLSTVS